VRSARLLGTAAARPLFRLACEDHQNLRSTGNPRGPRSDNPAKEKPPVSVRKLQGSPPAPPAVPLAAPTDVRGTSVAPSAVIGDGFEAESASAPPQARAASERSPVSERAFHEAVKKLNSFWRRGSDPTPFIHAIVRSRHPDAARVLAAYAGSLRQYAFEDAAPETRVAIDGIARVGGAQAYEMLEALMGEQRFVPPATQALVQLGGSSAVRVLTDELARRLAEEREQPGDAPTSLQVVTVAAGLAQLDQTSGVEILWGSLYNENRDVRHAAAAGLGASGTRYALQVLLRELGSNRDAEVRRDVADALGTLGMREAIPALRVCISDPDREVWRAASRALIALGEEPVS